jgi:hypothetical protein
VVAKTFVYLLVTPQGFVETSPYPLVDPTVVGEMFLYLPVNQAAGFVGTLVAASHQYMALSMVGQDFGRK